MDFNFTEDQNAIRELAYQIFTDRATDEFLLNFPAVTRPTTMASGPHWPSRVYWALPFPKLLAAAGWG